MAPKKLEPLAPTATILPSGCRTIADAWLNPGPKLLVCLPSPENVGSRFPGAALTTVEKAKPAKSAAIRTAPLLPVLPAMVFMGLVLPNVAPRERFRIGGFAQPAAENYPATADSQEWSP